ncbi:MAG: copper amine oxidase N-terminal domain-containing protein, partial [Clostridiales bacterium]|nr:copper amine oxidase N-terminal domain-containing protein [Clostridiales bacterium]
EVEWSSETQIIIKDGENTIELDIGNNVAKVNGKDVTLAVAPKIINDDAYVPVRFIGESLGFKVGWYGGRKNFRENRYKRVSDEHYLADLSQVMFSRYPEDSTSITESEALDIAKELLINYYERETGKKYEAYKGSLVEDEWTITYEGETDQDTWIVTSQITDLKLSYENDRFFAFGESLLSDLIIDKYTREAYYHYEDGISPIEFKLLQTNEDYEHVITLIAEH